MNPKVLIWMACACTCYPLALGFRASRCGACGEFADQPCQAPLDGKAYRLHE